MGKISNRKFIEAIIVDEDSNDENFDGRSDLDIIPHREKKGNSESSDLDIQMECLKMCGNPMKLKVLQDKTTVK